MAPIKVYKPEERRNHHQRFSGGTLGNLYHSVIKGAKSFLNSSHGQKLKTGIKRQILQTGSSVINDALAGISPVKSLKKGSQKLKKKLKKSDLKALKASILGKGKTKGQKLGGLMLYRLNKAKAKKQADLRYRLNKRRPKKKGKKKTKKKKTKGSKGRKKKKTKGKKSKTKKKSVKSKGQGARRRAR